MNRAIIYSRRLIAPFFLLITSLSLFTTGCTTPIIKDDLATWDVAKVTPEPGKATDILPLESGQIIVTSSENTLDIFASLLPESYNPYVHAAVLSLENGKPYVYEEFGRQWLNPFAESPTDAVFGRVKRVPLHEFLERYAHIEIWDPVELDKSAIVAFAQLHFAQRTPFDPYFDNNETDALYCTEFVAQALEAGGAAPFPVIAMRDNRSARTVLDWLKVPDGLIQADTLIASSTRVATLSLTRTLTEIRLTDEVRHEFYRRFTCDQRVGNLFAVNGPTVRLRDPAEQFLATAMILFDPSASPPDIATIRTTVRALANDHFGPFDPNITCR
jgi:hypothetical protein